MQAARQVLAEYFGYADFRPGQQELIEAIFAERDALGIMPTGAGKSVCYQVPAMVLPGITLVISPLISLMKDQVRALGAAGIRAAYLNSSLTFRQYCKALDNARQGMYKVIYVAPERLESEGFLDFARNADISLLAVDEAHCVSQWGHDFRPAYLNVAWFLDQLPRRPRLAAFTATATPAVREDILRLLQLQNPKTVVTGFDRPNLYFAVEKPEDKKEAVLLFVERHKAENGIIYCSTRKNVETVCQLLCDRGYDAIRYHAGLSDEERMRNQDDFRFDRARIMVATNAFGMGIDKQDVGYVLHYNMPKNLESYYQEAGRAGRDGSEATCLLLYGAGDVHTARYFIENAANDDRVDPAVRQQQQKIEEEKLEKMKQYCFTGRCLRNYILEYFGEKTGERCGKCGSCRKLTAAMAALGSTPARTAELDKTLYEILKSVRADYAKMYQLPPDLIFTDHTLQELCRKLPSTEEALLQVSGVTPAKVKRFGKPFLKAIARHADRRSGV
jgi:ATP-dependent DNA helicase RecQ